ncbi:MAG: hypothetical protein CW716_01320 [Candidatus Bathyarchaeum sp.]|nr:MAG: hypothetical protein CW716_01320 [Candidatus Bathyarchaeum sp.]
MTNEAKESKLETVISILLIVGVVVSVVLEAVGIALYFGVYGDVNVSSNPAVYIQGENFFAFVVERLQNLFVAENAIAFMTVGIIVLFLTPYIRGITSAIYFGWEKNWKYVAITLFVLFVLTLSLALH